MNIRFLMLLLPTTIFADQMDSLPQAPEMAYQPVNMESVNKQFQKNNQHIQNLLDNISQKLTEVNQHTVNHKEENKNVDTPLSVHHEAKPVQQAMATSSGSCKIDLSRAQNQYAQSTQATSKNSNESQDSDTLPNDNTKAPNTESTTDAATVTNSDANNEPSLVPANKDKLISSLSEIGDIVNGITSSIVSLNQDITSGLKEAKILELQGNQDDAKQSLQRLYQASEKNYNSLLSQQTQVDDIMNKVNELLQGIDPSTMEETQKALVKIKFNNNENKQDLKHIGNRLEQIAPTKEDAS